MFRKSILARRHCARRRRCLASHTPLRAGRARRNRRHRDAHAACRSTSVGAPVIVITRNDIERSLASDVSELLQQHAGLEIARNGGPGQTTSLFTRGTESNHTVVLIDGVRINPGTIGGAALQNIAPESLERIEIVKGPRSSLYGTDAIGGVVQLFTRGAAKDGVSARRHLRQQCHAADVRRRGAVGRASTSSSASAAATPRATACPPSSTTTSIAAIATSPARAFAEFAATDALKFRARGWRSHRPHRILGADIRRSAVRARLAGFREQRVFVRRRIPRAGRPRRARQRRAARSTTSSSCRPASARRSSTMRARGAPTVDVQVDLARDRHACVSASAPQHSDENTRAQSFGTVFDEDTHGDAGFRAGPVRRSGRARLAPRARLRGSRNLRQRSHLERRIRRRPSAAARASRCRGGKAFRAPDSTDRFGFGGNPDLDPEVSEQVEISVRQKLGDRQQLSLLGVRQPHRRSHRLRDHRLQHLRRRRTRTSSARASRASSSATSSRAKPGALAPSSRCRIRATKPPTSACCAVRANR